MGEILFQWLYFIIFIGVGGFVGSLVKDKQGNSRTYVGVAVGIVLFLLFAYSIASFDEYGDPHVRFRPKK